MASTLGQLNPLRYRGYVYDQETGLYYLQSRYYDPEVGRFLNADAFTSTGQGVLGNNMFAYCLNSPVFLVDSSGNACVMTCSGDVNLLVRDLSGFHSAIGGGGGGGGLVNERSKRSGTLYINEESVWGGTKYGVILPWEYDFFSVSGDGFTIIDASVALMDGGIRWEHLDIGFFKCFSAEASAGISSKKGVHAGFMASMLSADITISIWIIDVQLVGYVGSLGAKASLNVDGFSVALAPGGVGGEISVKFDLGVNGGEE